MEDIPVMTPKEWLVQVGAEKVRQIRTFRPGRVAVVCKSAATGLEQDGTRKITQDINLSTIRDEIADLIESGDKQGAAELLDQALIAGYEGADVHDDSGLAGILSISDFQEDPDVVYEQEAAQ